MNILKIYNSVSVKEWFIIKQNDGHGNWNLSHFIITRQHKFGNILTEMSCRNVLPGMVATAGPIMFIHQL